MFPGVRDEHLLPLVLSFAAGYIEAICFIGLFRTFTTFITGTLMVLVIELVNGESGYLNKAVVFVCFFAFNFVWIFLIKTWRWRLELRKPVLLCVEAVLIVAFAASGVALEPLQSAGSLNTLVVSVMGVLAMSLHSAIFFVLLSQYAPTHFMTGNLTNFSVGVVDALLQRRGSGSDDAETLKRTKFKIWHYPLVISFFVVGVALGSAGFLNFGFVVLVLPAIAIAVAAFLVLRIELKAKHA